MSDPVSDPVDAQHLGDTLQRITDDLPTRDLAGPALRRAATTRRRRRAAAVGSLVAAVAAVAVVVPVALHDRDPGRVSPSPAAPTPSTPDEAAVDPASGPWDPFTLADAPAADSRLPADLAPPADAPSVLDEPIDAALVAWPAEDRDLALLAPDGSWRTVPGTASALDGTPYGTLSPVLTVDGRTVATSTRDGLLVVDVVAGEQRLLPWPEPIAEAWEAPPQLQWMPGDDALLVAHWQGPWVMGLDGSAERAPYDGSYDAGVVVAPDGPALQWRWRQGELARWDGDEVVGTTDVPWEYGERFTARFGLVGLTGSLGSYPSVGPVVARADTGEVVASRSIRDRSSAYSDNGHLTVLGLSDPDTAVLLVGPVDYRSMEPADVTWYLVEWSLADDEVRVLTRGDVGLSDAAVAVDAIG